MSLLMNVKHGNCSTTIEVMFKHNFSSLLRNIMVLLNLKLRIRIFVGSSLKSTKGFCLINYVID